MSGSKKPYEKPTVMLQAAYPCPLCWGTQQGVGVTVKTKKGDDIIQNGMAGLKCDRCGHTWWAIKKEGELKNCLPRETKT